jgi:hypothetical protein
MPKQTNFAAIKSKSALLISDANFNTVQLVQTLTSRSGFVWLAKSSRYAQQFTAKRHDLSTASVLF